MRKKNILIVLGLKEKFYFFPSVFVSTLQFNQDLYSSTGVPLAATSTSTSSSHSPCSPLLPPSLNSAAASSSNHLQSSVASNTSAIGQRHVTKEEDLSVPRNEEGKK